MTDFAHRLKSARSIKHMSQSDLAKAIGMSQMQVCHFERGRREPSAKNLRKIIRSLDVSADYLLGITSQPTPPLLSETLADQIWRLSSDQTEILIGLLAIFRKRNGEKR